MPIAPPLHPGIVLVPEEHAWLVLNCGRKFPATVKGNSGENVSGIEVATAIWWDESRGNTAARRDHTDNQLGGNDNGYCQINDGPQGWPQATADIVWHPIRAMRFAFDRITKNGVDWSLYNYGPNAYGPRIKPPYTPRPARTLDLERARQWLANARNPYWRMHDYNVDVLSSDLGMVRPVNTPYLSTLPRAPMRPGYNGSDGRNRQLQLALASIGNWRNTNGTVKTTFDDYYGPTVERGLLLLTNWMAAEGLPITPGTLYTEQVRVFWDALQEWTHVRLGR